MGEVEWRFNGKTWEAWLEPSYDSSPLTFEQVEADFYAEVREEQERKRLMDILLATPSRKPTLAPKMAMKKITAALSGLQGKKAPESILGRDIAVQGADVATTGKRLDL